MKITLLGAGGKMGGRITANLQKLSHCQVDYVEASEERRKQMAEAGVKTTPIEEAFAMYAPILRTHRVTVEQMAILEPAVVESTMATCIATMREAMDRAVDLGVPEQAARDFCLGHIRTLTAVAFGFAGFPISDGAIKAIEQNRPRIFHDNGKEEVISLPAIRQSVRDICAV
jgi:hypothetical protein